MIMAETLSEPRSLDLASHAGCSREDRREATMATKMERLDRRFYQEVRDRMRRALGESPSEQDIRVHRREARRAFHEHGRLRTSLERKSVPSPAMRPSLTKGPSIYDQDSERMQRALGELPRDSQIRSHRSDAIAAFGEKREPKWWQTWLRRRG
jgi:hypothetical protein